MIGKSVQYGGFTRNGGCFGSFCHIQQDKEIAAFRKPKEIAAFRKSGGQFPSPATYFFLYSEFNPFTSSVVIS